MAVTSVLPHTVGGVLLLVPVLVLLYTLSVWIYNIFFHPLSHFPGPKTAAASPIPKISASLRGDGVHWVNELHLKYGEVVRVAPNELSFTGGDAWKDLYGHKKAGQATLAKDPKFYKTPGEEVQSIVTAGPGDHPRQRRIFANAFSDNALKKQEPMFLKYVDKLVEKLRNRLHTDPKTKFDMVNMYNYTTFDIMGDLTFGEPLGMLDQEGYHPWVAAMFAGFRFGVYLHSIRYFPLVEAILLKFIPESIREKQRLHHEFSHARVDRRLEKQDARPDIWGLVLDRDEERGLSKAEMYANGNIFMLAGTETTATTLSGVTYYLLTNPDTLRRLTDEIRGAFPHESDITIERLQALKYLHACLEEGLRMYPPVAAWLPRIVPVGGAMIDGHHVPGDTQVYATHFAMYRNPNNFRKPNSFIPERWLPDNKEFASDKKHALQPFSTGPRVCLGKNMAYHEMRIILAKVLWNFDMHLCSESQEWNKQKIFIMWDKQPLYVQLKYVR